MNAVEETASVDASERETVTGEEVTTLITKGASPRWQGFSYTQSGMLFVTSENVRDGYLDLSKPKFLPLEFHKKIYRSRIQKGDILINLVGASIGRSCLVREELGEANINQAVAVFRPVGAVDSSFLSYYFQLPETIERILGMQVEAARPNISLGDLRRFELALPPREEQEAIAEALSDADALIEGLERLIAKKRLIKQGAMQDLLTAKRRLPGFSGEWVNKKLGEFGKFKNGINKPTEAFGSGYPFVNLADVFGVTSIQTSTGLGLVETTSVERKVYDVRSGDVLFIRSSVKPSGVGLTALVENDLQNAVFSGFILRFRDSQHLAKAFKRHCFYEASFRASVIAASTVSANTNVNQTALRALEISYPTDQTEQEAIGTALSDMDAEIQALETRLEKARQVKEGMMQNLLTGRIRLV